MAGDGIGRGAEVRPLPAVDVFAAIVAALLPIAISPVVYSYTFSPKLAVDLVVAGAGIPLLVRLAIRSPRAWPARAGLGFLAVSLASALLSASRLVGFFGVYAWGTGWVFWCAVAGAWAIGASLSKRGRVLVVDGLLVGVGVNALVAVAQRAFELNSPAYGLYNGSQSDGLMGNPIYLESLLLGAGAILLVRSCRGSAWWALGGLLLAGALELSGERLGVLGLVALCCYGLVVFRSRAAVLFSASLVAGYGAAYVAGSHLVRSRLTTAADTLGSPRIPAWKAAAHGLAHHLLLGVGPGDFLAGYSPYQSLALARRLGPGVYFADAHDLLVEVTTTTGLLGLVSFLCFLGLAARRASGPLLGFAFLALVVELAEPLNVGVTPLAFLALGAAGPPVGDLFARSARRAWPVVAIRLLLVLFAVAAALDLLYGDFELSQGIDHYDLAQVQRGERALPIWAESDSLVAEVVLDRAGSGRDVRHWLLDAACWQERMVTADPTNPEYPFELGTTEVRLGNLALASEDFHEALRYNPFDAHALVGLGNLADRAGNWSSATRWYTLALGAAPSYNPAIDGVRNAREHRR